MGKQAANNMLNMDSFDDDDEIVSSALSSMKWFGGNWFDFWGKNEDQFFNQDLINNDNAENIKANNQIIDDDDDDDISIDNRDIDPMSSASSSQRTLQSKQKQSSISDELGRNAAGYKIIALPLYILIICIVSSAIIGMAMCAGFVYCGLNCCCPLPPASPTLTSQQRSLTLSNISLLQSLTLGGNKQKGYSSEPGVYHRMRNALHNATNDETSSIASAQIEEEDEYVDSEDDQKEDVITMGGPDDVYNREHTPFALRGTCDSDIDRDTEDEYEETLSALIQIPSSYQQHIEEEEEEKEVIIQTIEDPYDMRIGIDNEEYSEDDEEEESGDEDHNNEGTPLIINNNSNDVSSGSGTSNSVSIKSNNLP